MAAVHDLVDGKVIAAFEILTNSVSILRNASYTFHCDYEDVFKCLTDPQKVRFTKANGENILSALLLRDILYGPNLARTSNLEHEQSFVNDHYSWENGLIHDRDKNEL